MTDSTRKLRKKRESGSILVLLLLLMVPLMGLSSALIAAGARQVTEREASRGRALALLNAESGLHHAVAQLLGSPNDFTTVEASYEGSEALRYRVEVESLGEDGADNDADGEVDEAEEAALRRFVARGGVNVLDYDADGTPVTSGPKSFSKRLRAFGRTFSGMPSFPYAVYLGDPNAEIQFNGNSFAINGNDTNPDGTAGSEPMVPGIATTGDPGDIEDQLTNQQKDNVDGEGGEPSISTVASLDLQAIVDEYKAAADVVFTGNQNYTGNLGDADAGQYLVTYVNGTLKISGGAVGAGLLLVEGNLEITGGWDYTGIVVVTGQVIFRGGGGGKRVMGTLLVGGDVIDSGGGSDEDLEISGTVDVIYSSAAQSQVAEALSSMTLFGWQEL